MVLISYLWMSFNCYLWIFGKMYTKPDVNLFSASVVILSGSAWTNLCVTGLSTHGLGLVWDFYGW